MSPSIVDSLIESKAALTSSTEHLTKREEQVLALVLQGKNNQDIAELLHLGQQGVRNYVHAIYQKFHVTSRAELILLLHQQN